MFFTLTQAAACIFWRYGEDFSTRSQNTEKGVTDFSLTCKHEATAVYFFTVMMTVSSYVGDIFDFYYTRRGESELEIHLTSAVIYCNVDIFSTFYFLKD